MRSLEGRRLLRIPNQRMAVSLAQRRRNAADGLERMKRKTIPTKMGPSRDKKQDRSRGNSRKLNFTSPPPPILIRDACGAGHQEAADHTLLTLELLGDTVLTDFATVNASLKAIERDTPS